MYADRGIGCGHMPNDSTAKGILITIFKFNIAFNINFNIVLYVCLIVKNIFLHYGQ